MAEPLAYDRSDTGSPANGHADMSASAVALASSGYRVFPLFPNKKPMTRRGFLDATTDVATVRGWWDARPAALIGIAVPDETIVVDIDAYKDEYRADHGLALPASAFQETRQGGWQLLYRTDGRPARQTEGEAAPAIDTRVAGKGYVVAWEPETFLDKLPATWAPAPEWVYERPVRSSGTVAPDTMATRSEILSWLGTIAGRATVTKSEYLALLTAARSAGRIIARDAARPWTDDDFAKLAAEAAKWEQAEQGELVDDEPLPETVEETTDAWPDPPDEAVYRGVLGEITLAVAPHTEAHPVAILGTLLTMFGAACGGARSLYQGGLQRTNLSVLLVGRTGMAGRKGTSLDIGRDVARLVYPELAKLWLVGVASGEGITGHLRRFDGQDGRPYEPRVMVVEPEFGRVLTVMNREGSTLSAILRNAWDGVPMGYSRARDEVLITDHHVSMLGHITPAELKAKLTEVDTANGFVNRVLFLAVRREQLIPFPTSPDALVEPFVRRVHLAIIEAQAIRALEFDETARERWAAFYTELALTPRLGLAGAVSGRHETQVARLALVYALADRSPSVGVTHLEAAIALADYARRSVIWALGDSTGNRHADVLLRMLAEGEVGYDEAKRTLGLRQAADMAAVVAVLVDAGLAEVARLPKAGGGRAARVIRAKGAKGAKDARDART
jgi:hypothetical protein